MRYRQALAHLLGWQRRGGIVILTYHRIAEEGCDPQLLSVAPARFDRQLTMLRNHGAPMTLDEVVEAMRCRHWPRRAVAVTFDDGYADNLHQAKPLLERHRIPATVFVVAGAVGSSEGFWWDQLEGLLLRPGTLPADGELAIAGWRIRWSLNGDAVYSTQHFRQYAAWTVERGDAPTGRHRLYLSLCRALRPLLPALRDRALQELRAWANVAPSFGNTHRLLSRDELAVLGSGPLVDIGAHTHSHPVLSRLSPAAQQQEIHQGKVFLERLLNRPIRGFAYPYGTRRDYSRGTVRLARQAGFGYACANRSGTVGSWSDVYQLPRVVVRNWDGAELLDRLKGWWNA